MKTMRVPLSALEGVLIGESADSALEERVWFDVDLTLRLVDGAEVEYTARVLAFDDAEAKAAAINVIIECVELGEIKEVENG